MKLVKYREEGYTPALKHLPNSPRGRRWVIDKSFSVELSDGFILKIPKGFETDLRSSPWWLWSIIPPFNESLLAYLIHDRLYADKLGQMKHFSKQDKLGRAKPYVAKKFADEEMYRWASALAPSKKVENLFAYWGVKTLWGKRVYDGRSSVPQ